LSAILIGLWSGEGLMARSRKKSGGGGSPNKKLPLKQSIPLGIQHVLAMFAGIFTVALLMSDGKKPLHNLTLWTQGKY